tara:strand:- start:53777 stop:54562 length:786 start_codon:yes stop_codon:yes gene_type:complete
MAIHAIVPAAGVGSRMQAAVPKQYLQIQGESILSLSIRRLSQLPGLQSVTVALAPGDQIGLQIVHQLSATIATELHVAEGGAERWQSVINALQLLAQRAAPADWVLVHDAVRPCVRVQDLQNLVQLAEHPDSVGGLLAIPVADTLKRAAPTDRIAVSRTGAATGGDTAVDINAVNVQTVASTIDRQNVWAACTPQMFRLDQLLDALQRCMAGSVIPTDESSAMEYCGYQPRLIVCHKDNIKITYPEDLYLAELILTSQVPA